MRSYLILLLLLIAYCNVLKSQLQWEQVPLNLQYSNPTIIYQSKDRVLYGFSEIEGYLYMSTDNGISWELLNSEYHFRDIISIHESTSGDLYFTKASDANQVFYLDLDSLQIKRAFEVSGVSLNFEMSSNDKLLFTTDSKLDVFNLEGTKEIQLVYDKPIANIYVDGRIYLVLGIPSFTGEIFELVVLDESYQDLYSIEELPLAIGGQISKINSRLFFEDNYSDDGGFTWDKITIQGTPMVNDIFEFKQVAGDTILLYGNFGYFNDGIYISSYVLLISTDHGVSFNTISMLNKPIEFFGSNDGVVLLNYLDNVSNILYQYKYDPKIPFEQNYQFDKVLVVPSISENTPIVKKVIAGNNGNLFAADHYSNSRFNSFKQSHDSIWKPIPSTYFFDSYYFEDLLLTPIGFMPLSNGNIIMFSRSPVSYYVIHISSDGGLTWNLLSSDVHISLNNRIHSRNNFSAYVSRYSGDVLLSYDGFNTIVSTINTGQNFTYSDFSFLDENYKLHDLYTCESLDLISGQMSSEQCFDMPCSFLIASKYSSLIFSHYLLGGCLSYSDDLGETFKNINVPDIDLSNSKIAFDHLDNIFIYDDDSIWITNDLGSNWNNITPNNFDFEKINSVSISFDDVIYVATANTGILKLSHPYSAKDIIVNAFIDENKNCIKDIGEVAFPNIIMSINNNCQSPTDEFGEANFIKNLSSGVVSAKNLDSELFTSCSEFIEFEIVEDIDSFVVDYPIHVINECTDLSVSGSTHLLRRCFDNSYTINVFNKGATTAINSEVIVSLDTFMVNVASNLSFADLGNNNYSFYVDTIPIFGEFNFTINFELSCDADLGFEHCIHLDVKSNLECIHTLQDNSYVECRKNIGSFDPNDKSIFVDGIAHQNYCELDSKLEYLIRFQNTGTDTAFNIRIEDQLAKEIDIESFEVLVASHDYRWEINRDKLLVEFEDIQLVDSVTNESLSHGFIKFSVALNEFADEQNILKNKANIFFDFNSAIQTNEVKTILGKPSNTQDIEKPNLLIYPNPANEFITISLEDSVTEYNHLIIYNIYGQIKLTGSFIESNFIIDVSNFDTGTYIVELQNSSGIKATKKFIII